ncbi:MAG: SpoIIE family protein phosphatase [Bacteroidota bacterium]
MPSFLIIDDNPDDQAIIERYIRKGYQAAGKEVDVHQLESEEELHGFLNRKDNPPMDAVLVDYSLHWTTGLEVYKKISKSLSTCPVLMLTGNGDELVGARAIKLGFSDYLIKNRLSSSYLLHSIDNAITRKKEQLELARQRKLLKKRNQELRTQKAQLNLALEQLTKDNVRKTRELEEARQLQMSMLPQGPLDNPHVEVHTYMHTAQEVGGDYYDYLKIDEQHAIAIIGDVTGHGFKSGVIVATVKSYFRNLANRVSPGEMMEAISTGIRSLGLKNMYMGLTILDITPGKISITSSGMPRLLHYQAHHDQVTPIVSKGMFLGASIPPNTASQTIDFGPEDMLLAYTDGLEECFNDKRQQIGWERICKVFEESKKLGGEATILGLVGFAKRWAGQTCQYEDDITLMLLSGKRVPAPLQKLEDDDTSSAITVAQA